jgi:hypothetical protein
MVVVAPVDPMSDDGYERVAAATTSNPVVNSNLGSTGSGMGLLGWYLFYFFGINFCKRLNHSQKSYFSKQLLFQEVDGSLQAVRKFGSKIAYFHKRLN